MIGDDWQGRMAEVLWLRHGRGWTLRKIAAHMGTSSQETVRIWLATAHTYGAEDSRLKVMFAARCLLDDIRGKQ